MKIEIVKCGKRGKPKRISVCVSAIIAKDGKVLLVKRRSFKSFAGYWGVPTGKVKAGETLEEALKREVKEETGLVVKPEKLCHIAQEFHDDHHHLVFAFRAKVIGGRLKAGSDVCKAKWFDLKKIRVKLQPVARRQLKILI